MAASLAEVFAPDSIMLPILIVTAIGGAMAYSVAGRWTAEAGAAVGSAGASAGAGIAPADEEEEVSHWVVHF